MARLRPDFASGKLTDASISATVQQLNSPSFANLPVVTAPDIVVIQLDPLAVYGPPEFATVTNHALNSQTVTVSRGTDGTKTYSSGVGAARTHNQGGVQEDWYVSASDQDFVHANLSGLGSDDHSIYALADGTRPFTGNVTMDAGLTVDGPVVFNQTATAVAPPTGSSDGTVATTQFVASAVSNTQTLYWMS